MARSDAIQGGASIVCLSFSGFAERDGDMPFFLIILLLEGKTENES
jgi:hypothetical protein